MPSFEVINNVPNKTPTECFHIACDIYSQIGFTIWKKREIGWLVLAKKSEKDMEIDSNFSARPTKPTSITVVVSSSKATQEDLEKIANLFIKEFLQKTEL